MGGGRRRGRGNFGGMLFLSGCICVFAMWYLLSLTLILSPFLSRSLLLPFSHLDSRMRRKMVSTKTLISPLRWSYKVTIEIAERERGR
jgi:hypothetical protein